MTWDHQQAAQFLHDRDGFLILTHRRPDGDTVGCAIALCKALRRLGKTAYVLPNPDATALFDPYWGDVLAPADFQPDTVVSADVAKASSPPMPRPIRGRWTSAWTTTPPTPALPGITAWRRTKPPAGS